MHPPLVEHSVVEIKEIHSGEFLAEERLIPFERPPRKVLANDSVFNRKLHLPTKVYAKVCDPIKNPCNYSAAIIDDNECLLEMSSFVTTRVNFDKKPRVWGKLIRYGVNAEFANACSFKKEDENLVCKQTLKVSLQEGHDWGMIQLQCQNNELYYRGKVYSQGSRIILFFYRSMEELNDLAFPPIIVASKFYTQNYLPVIPGQLLMLISGKEYSMQDDFGNTRQIFQILDEVREQDKYAIIYSSKSMPEERECILMTDDDKSNLGIFVSPIYKQGDMTYTVVLEPAGVVFVNCENVNMICIKFIKEIPVIRNHHSQIEIVMVDVDEHEVLLSLHKSVQGLTIVKKSGTIDFYTELR